MRLIFAIFFLFLATWVHAESFGEDFNGSAAMIKERDEELDDILNDGDDKMDKGKDDLDEEDEDDEVDDEDENDDGENDTIDENIDDPMKVGTKKKKCGRALGKCLRSCNKATMKCFKRAAKKCKSNEERGCAKVSYECAAETCEEKERMKGKGKKKPRRCIRHFKKCLEGEGSGMDM